MRTARYYDNPPTLASLTTAAIPSADRAWNGEAFPEETRYGFQRNIQTICDHAISRGADAMLATMPLRPSDLEAPSQNGELHREGALDNNEVLRKLAEEKGYLLCDLERIERENFEPWRPEFTDQVHLTSAGNRIKAEQIGRVLIEEWVPTLD